MKVDNRINPSLRNNQSQKTDNVSSTNATLRGKAPVSLGGETDADKISLSDKALDIQKMKKLATPDMNSVDEAKVAKFQQLIDEGKYKVNAEAVADRLVDEHLMI